MPVRCMKMALVVPMALMSLRMRSFVVMIAMIIVIIAILIVIDL